jgi:hypothetical protein
MKLVTQRPKATAQPFTVAAVAAAAAPAAAAAADQLQLTHVSVLQLAAWHLMHCLSFTACIQTHHTALLRYHIAAVLALLPSMPMLTFILMPHTLQLQRLCRIRT